MRHEAATRRLIIWSTLLSAILGIAAGYKRFFIGMPHPPLYPYFSTFIGILVINASTIGMLKEDRVRGALGMAVTATVLAGTAFWIIFVR